MILYHWSPTTRRDSIEANGFRPGSRSTDDLWNPPYTCWADSPSLAWGLSGAMERGAEHPSWDLWMIHAEDLDDYEELPFDEGGGIKEYRVYEPIADPWYVATRVRSSSS